jgi:hypothetical protein
MDGTWLWIFSNQIIFLISKSLFSLCSCHRSSAFVDSHEIYRYLSCSLLSCASILVVGSPALTKVPGQILSHPLVNLTALPESAVAASPAKLLVRVLYSFSAVSRLPLSQPPSGSQRRFTFPYRNVNTSSETTVATQNN